MATSVNNRKGLFSKREKEYPEYSEFINILALNKNSYGKNLMAHFKCDAMRAVIFSMQDCLEALQEDVYSKFTSNLSQVNQIIDHVLHQYEDSESTAFCLYVGIRDHSGHATIEQVSQSTGLSKKVTLTRIKRIRQDILKKLNADLLDNKLSLESTGTYTIEEKAPSLINKPPKEITYTEFMDNMAKFTRPFIRSSLQCIKSKPLRAILGSFHDSPDKLTERLYNKLTSDIVNLDNIIDSFIVTNCEDDTFSAFWQLGKYSNVLVSAESLAAYGKKSVTTVMRSLNNVSASLQNFILSMYGETYTSVLINQIDPVKEEKLIRALVKELSMPISGDTALRVPSVHEAMTTLFYKGNPKGAATTRLLLNGVGYNEVREILAAADIDSSYPSDAALRSRKYRWLKELKENSEFVRLDGMLYFKDCRVK